MKKGRFEVIEESKFDQLSKKQMSESRGGGICIACVKRKRKWKQGLELGPVKHEEKLSVSIQTEFFEEI